MSQDLEIIRALEKRHNLRLERGHELKLNEIRRDYVLDEEGYIVGLQLDYVTLDEWSFLTAFSRLNALCLYKNNITDWSFLSSLTDLTNLDISRNEITDGSFLCSLTNLTHLNLAGNRITDWSFLSSLTDLTDLDISVNKITDGSFLSSLTNLRRLNLRRNLIQDVEFLRTLNRLRVVDLHKNRIRVLPEFVTSLGPPVKWTRLLNEGIILEDNPLESPPVEIVKQGHDAVVNYFKSLAKEREQAELFEAKLLVVGYGDVGKTVLKHRLMQPDISESALKTKSTEGIDIDTWPVATKRSNHFITHFWDFGGQEIYHATHQFFLTKRSLYLFVWEARTDDDLLSFDYWLNTISILSDNAPILVIQNKIDERKKAVNQTKWKKLFPNIVGFYDVSALKGRNTNELSNTILAELDELPHIGTKLPKSWQDIRERLEKMPDNYISFTKYKAICDEYDLDEEQATFLSDYFHCLGVFLHFRSSAILRNTVFLKPDWATNAVYKVTDAKVIKDNFGRFHFSQLAEIWIDRGEFPESCFIDLIELMKNFELCFELPDKQNYIIPELLRIEQPELPPLDDADVLRFQFEYDFMPAGVMTRFIVKTHDLIRDDLYWKDGVVLQWQEAEARVMKTDARRIQVWITGRDRTTLLGMIRRDMGYINTPFHNLDVRELVPCICRECQQAEEANQRFFQYEKELLRARERGKREIECRSSFDDVSIDSLLGAIGNREYENMPPETRTVKLFVASSGELKKEREQVELLVARENRKLNRRNLFIEVVLWEELSHSFRGERVQDYFSEKMLECEVVLFLFYTKAGQYTLEEFKKAYAAFKDNKKPNYLYVYFKDTPINPSQIVDKDIRKLRELKNEIEDAEQIYTHFETAEAFESQLKKQIDLLVDDLG